VTVAHRVAQEMGSEIGRQVGYAIRFEERTSQDTRIVYLTGASPPPAPPCLEDTASWTDPVVGCQNAWPTEKTRQVKGREVSSVGNRREGRGGLWLLLYNLTSTEWPTSRGFIKSLHPYGTPIASSQFQGLVHLGTIKCHKCCEVGACFKPCQRFSGHAAWCFCRLWRFIFVDFGNHWQNLKSPCTQPSGGHRGRGFPSQ